MKKTILTLAITFAALTFSYGSDREREISDEEAERITAELIEDLYGESQNGQKKGPPSPKQESEITFDWVSGLDLGSGR